MNIGIFIYNNAEVLDFSGLFEVLTTASWVCKDRVPFEVFLISEEGNTVRARAGYKAIPDYGFGQHPDLDILVVVGGVHTEEMGKTRVIEWIRAQAKKARFVASVCTGAFILAQAGIFDTKRVAQLIGRILKI